MDYAMSLAGLFVGVLIGATGVGGGSLMTPILVILFGVPASAAVGTDLLFAALTKGAGTALHGFNRSISWKVVGRLASGSIPASLAMLWLLHNVIDQNELGDVITVSLGIALVLTSLAIFLQPLLRKIFRKGSPSDRPGSSEDPYLQKRMLQEEEECEARPESVLPTVVIGAILGTLVSLTSVGAGALGVMVLMTLYPKVRSVRIIGTDIAHAVPLTLVAGLGHASIGVVNYSILASLLLGSIPGIALGSHLAFRLPEKVMRQSLAGILICVGGKLIFV